MEKFVALRAKIYNYLKYLTNNNDADRKTKGREKCVIKTELKFQDFKNYLKATQLENKINHLKK